MLYRLACLIALLACVTALAAQPSVTGVAPPRHDNDAAQAANVTANFTTSMATPASNAFSVRSNLRGRLSGALSVSGAGITFNPAANLLAGEELEVVMTTGVQSNGGQPLALPHIWRFCAATGSGPTDFQQNCHTTGASDGWDVEIGDLDADGDLDMVSVTNGQGLVLINDGHGVFAATAFGQGDGSYACELVDADGDADLDIAVANAPVSAASGQQSGQDRIWLNDGSGTFSTSISLGTSSSYTIDCAVGDLDGDGDVDILMSNGGLNAEANDIWLNNGSGSFTRRAFLWTSSSTAEYTDNSWGVRLADADNDGDLDVFTANFGLSPVQSYLLYNDGAANFYWTSSIPLGPTAIALDLAVADFNSDGWVDVAFAQLGQSASGTYNRVSVHFNNGSGGYGSATTIGAGATPYGLEAADVDGDGDMDLGVGIEAGQSYIMTNNGTGPFAGSIAIAGSGLTAYALEFADVDGDGDLDCATPGRLCVNGYRAPYIEVTSNGGAVSNGGTINVNWGTTLAALNLAITIKDPDGQAASNAASITNGATQGFQVGEFAHTTAATPYTLSPTSGTFNQGNVTHTVTMTANDGYSSSGFGFDIVVGPAPNNAPDLAVTRTAGSVPNGSSFNVAFGTTLASLGLQITVDDPDGGTVSLSGTVSNAGSTGMLHIEFSSAAQAVAYTLNPGSGSFNQAGVTHVVSLSANDGSGGAANFSFSIVVGAQPTPEIGLYETSLAGTSIPHGAAVGGGRDFGSQDVGSGPTSALTVVIYNSGTGALAISAVSLAGADAAHFVLDTTTTAASVGPNGYTQFTVSFDPASAGTKSANVNISHNDTSNPNPYYFSVAGVGTTPAPVPVIVVREGGVTLANGAAPAGGRAFGVRTTGAATAPIVITVENAGTVDLVLGTPTVTSSEFALNLAGFASTVPAGQTTNFTVAYLATTEGAQSATVSFTHNDSTTATPFTFDVSGTAVAPGGAGNTAGSGSGGGGGCTAIGGSSIALLGACLMFAFAMTRARRKAA